MLQTHQGQLAVTEVCVHFKNALVLLNIVHFRKSKQNFYSLQILRFFSCRPRLKSLRTNKMN